MTATTSPTCPLCAADGGRLLVRTAEWRVIEAVGGEATDYPGLLRVVWNAHVAELTDLTVAQRHALLDVVATVEQCIRDTMAPTKVNLAAFGNQVPHLHWHLIPRWADDAHFPAPVWAPVARTVSADWLASRREAVQRLAAAVIARLGT